MIFHVFGVYVSKYLWLSLTFCSCEACELAAQSGGRKRLFVQMFILLWVGIVKIVTADTILMTFPFVMRNPCVSW